MPGTRTSGAGEPAFRRRPVLGHERVVDPARCRQHVLRGRRWRRRAAGEGEREGGGEKHGAASFAAAARPAGPPRAGPPDLRESIRGRPLPQVPPPDLRGGRGPGGGRADADERDRAGQGAAGVPLRRPARHRQDLARADPREVGQLRARPDRDARQHVPRVRRDLGRLVARRDRDGRCLAARHRRHPRDPRPRRAAAGRGPLEGLHPRRGAPADRRGVERAAEADRGAAAAPPLRLLHDRAAEGAADRALALPDLRLPAPAAPRPDPQAAPDRRRRADRRARRGARADRARRPRRIPRRGVDARPARRRHRRCDHGAGRAAAARRGRGRGALPALRHGRRQRHGGRADVPRGDLRRRARTSAGSSPT